MNNDTKMNRCVKTLLNKDFFVNITILEYVYITCSNSGSSPYPRMDGRKIANLLQEGYRMPKLQHLDDKLYVNMVLLLSVLGFACLFFWLFVFFMAFIVHSICPGFVRVACAPQDSPFLLVKPA